MLFTTSYRLTALLTKLVKEVPVPSPQLQQPELQCFAIPDYWQIEIQGIDT